MTKKVFDRMKTTVVLVNLLLGQGLSDMLTFRLNGTIKITKNESEYTLQLSQLEISIYQAVDGIRVYDKSKNLTCNIQTHNDETYYTHSLHDCIFETSQSFTLACDTSMSTLRGPLTTTPCTTTPASCPQDTIRQTTLGSMVGLLMVLLVVVTIGWV